MIQGGHPVRIQHPNRLQKLLGVWRGWGGVRWVGWSPARIPKGGGVPQHTYLKMIPIDAF